MLAGNLSDPYLSHSKTKYTSKKIKAPASGACREGRPRLKTITLSTSPWQEELARKTRRLHLRRHASAQHAPRQGPRSDKLQGPARSRPRQGACRGELTLCARAPAHRPTRRPGVLPGTRGGWLCSLGDTVASRGDEPVVVANGDARADTFWGDGDGHSMPLSPTVWVRYRSLYNHCAYTVHALFHLPPNLHFYPPLR